MNTINIHNVVSARLTPVKSMPIIIPGMPNRTAHMRDLLLVNDVGHKTTITIFADEAPEQISTAAPDLLAALSQIERLTREADGITINVRAMLGDIARAAIAKAEGKQ